MICSVYMIKSDKIRFCWKIGIFWVKSPQKIFLDFLSKSNPLTFSMSWKLLVFKLRPKISSVNQIWVFFNLQYILTGFNISWYDFDFSEVEIHQLKEQLESVVLVWACVSIPLTNQIRFYFYYYLLIVLITEFDFLDYR